MQLFVITDFTVLRSTAVLMLSASVRYSRKFCLWCRCEEPWHWCADSIPWLCSYHNSS